MEEECIGVLHSGSAGDILYSLLYLKKLSERYNKKINIFINNFSHYSQGSGYYELLKDLIAAQPYINKVECAGEYPLTHVVYLTTAFICAQKKLHVNLDNVRINFEPFNTPYPIQYFNIKGFQDENNTWTFPVEENWYQPWMEVPVDPRDINENRFSLVNRSMRYRKNNACVEAKIKQLQESHDVYFVGTDEEYDDMNKIVKLERIITKDYAELAQYISRADNVIVNPTCGLAIAQAIGCNNIILEVPDQRIGGMNFGNIKELL